MTIQLHQMADDEDVVSQKAAFQALRECTATLREEIQRQVSEKDDIIAKKDSTISQLRQQLNNDRKLRMRVTDELVGLKGGFRLLVVPKPPELDSAGEDADKVTSKAQTQFDHATHTVTIPNEEDGLVQFKFDYVFQPKLGSIDHIWRECEDFVDGVFNEEPRRLLMLAHGRTNSGKTYIMADTENWKHGMMYRTLSHIFGHKEKLEATGHAVTIEATAVLMHKGDSTDQDGTKLEYRHVETRYEAHYAKLKSEPGPWTPVKRQKFDTLDVASEFFKKVHQKRLGHTSKTAANDTSSRSFLVVAFFVLVEEEGAVVREGSIHLVDLAGNEDEQASSELNAERIAINQGLSGLGGALKRVRARSNCDQYERGQQAQGLRTRDDFRAMEHRERFVRDPIKWDSDVNSSSHFSPTTTN